jgi:hypothetical protein
VQRKKINLFAKNRFYCAVMALMALCDMLRIDQSSASQRDDAPREMIQISFRLFKDQYRDLRWLAANRYRSLRNVSDLIREAIEQFIERQG